MFRATKLKLLENGTHLLIDTATFSSKERFLAQVCDWRIAGSEVRAFWLPEADSDEVIQEIQLISPQWNS